VRARLGAVKPLLLLGAHDQVAPDAAAVDEVQPLEVRLTQRLGSAGSTATRGTAARRGWTTGRGTGCVRELRVDLARPRLVLCLLCVALLEGGCATVFALSPDRVEGGLYESPDSPKSFPRVYSGTIGDGYCLTHDRSGQIGFWCLLDLPLSLAADTVVLPFTAYQQVRHGNYHARCIPEQREQTCKVRKQAVESAIESCRNQHEPRSKTCRSMIAMMPRYWNHWARASRARLHSGQSDAQGVAPDRAAVPELELAALPRRARLRRPGAWSTLAAGSQPPGLGRPS